jgi:hypothetical protein
VSLIEWSCAGVCVAMLAASEAPVHQYILYDGPSGVTARYWNRALGIVWQNVGGDWRDRNEAPQGPTPYATGTLRDGRVHLDVTTLVRRWLVDGNTGLFVRTNDAALRIAAREDPNTARRPLLAVETDAGQVLCPSTADSSITPSTARSVGETPTLSGGRYVMQFDLSSVKGAVQRATLTLCAVPPAGGAVQVEVMRLDAPRLLTRPGDVGRDAVRRSGLAQAFPYDRGIQSHPDVLFATDFAGETWKTYFTDAVSDPTFGRDPLLQSTYIRGQFIPGSTGSSNLDYQWTAHGRPEPEEIYFRYYVFLENDWGSLVDGNKMPGLAGRYGIWNGRSYTRVTGNGGERTVGDAIVDEQGRRVLRGWSMRTVAYRKPNDDNPYRDLTGLITYAYHVDQRGNYGDGWRWGAACLERNRWYCIEQYAKMNTVAGPFDKNGNGTGKPDGVLRVWVDGVPVLEKTDIRFRLNRDIKINEVWLNWYHGGTRPAQAVHHWRMANVVVARSYIGPMLLGAPTSAPATKPAY